MRMTKFPACIAAAATVFLSTSTIWAQAAPPTAPMLPYGARFELPFAYWFAPIGGIAALLMALFFYRSVMKHSEGDENMVRVAQAVRQGAYAYLRAQWKVVGIVFAVLLLILLAMGFIGLQDEMTFIGVGVAGLLSGLCGFFGMKTATNASARTANAAKHSLNDGLRVAFRAGAVMGLCVTGFALLDVSLWFFVLSSLETITKPQQLVVLTTITLSFAMGASLQALFSRVGGGIYTKAADVGADLVGKVEAGIPEDDARNPATIADNVGDNVGDVAGMGADLYESYYGSILAAMALGAAASVRLGLDTVDAVKLVIAPAALAGIGILASIIAIFLVRTKEGATMAQLLKSLHTGVWVSSLLIFIGSGVLFELLMNDIGSSIEPWGFWAAIVAGLVAGLVIAWGTERYTSYEHKPTQRIAEQAQTGPATVIIAGVAEGMISTWIPMLTTIAAILVAFVAAGGNEVFLMGVYGVAIAAVGMLSTLAITLATDAYGPIADNAGGNAEMTHQPPHVRERTDMLDSLGNTTAATGKGFAIGSAALTALALLAAYLATVQGVLVSQASVLPRPQIEGRLQPAQAVLNMFPPQPVNPDEGGEEPRPVAGRYIDNGIFQLYEPDAGYGEMLDAGLVLDQSRFETVEGILKRDKEPRTLVGMTDPDTGAVRFVVSGNPVYVYPASTASLPQIMQYYDVTVMNPRSLCGLFAGVMLVFVFCAMTMNAVGRAAFRMMQECRRQFGIMRQGFKQQGLTDEQIAVASNWPYEVTVDGHKYPDYGTCVAISTKGALREMIVPSLMAIVVPIIVGLVLGVAGVMGMLAGALVSGFAVAIFMANAGGAWDNAKKYIETGQYGGKGSDAHKAGVVGDTVGDPFKDTSGPSLNILIKLISIVSVVFAAVIVKYSPAVIELLRLG